MMNIENLKERNIYFNGLPESDKISYVNKILESLSIDLLREYLTQLKATEKCEQIKYYSPKIQKEFTRNPLMSEAIAISLEVNYLESLIEAYEKTKYTILATYFKN